ncbi:hypothetical protein [Actinoplanes sichuanensis]|uniref:Uncharacterized protein n=1 Tax=Actinoplanes sichuanensis TaxID=512349 RepID=A0ABW4A585_9ACTN|nr:hypothetical protein [Actinoplanes sichuanensis]
MTSRLPRVLLIIVICVFGVCGLPSALFFTAMAVMADGPVPAQILVFGVPALIAYPIAVWLCVRAGRARSTGRAWLAATLGMGLVIGSSLLPVMIIGSALAEEWKETRPGGRGHVGSAGPHLRGPSGVR